MTEESSPQTIYYRRGRFSARLPTDRLYTPSHFWLLEDEPGVWSVGFTKFASRMLGDLVELNFQAASGDAVDTGQTVGTVEGFKALSELYCVVDGVFLGHNPALDADLTLADAQSKPDSWLYRVRGAPEAHAVDVNGYVEFLNLTIDKMKEQYDDQSKPC